jgi:SAM-dependent methyltransferase
MSRSTWAETAAPEVAMEWFEDEQFWSTFDAYIFSPERLQGADAQVDQILALTGLSGGAALDLCCGPGRHAVALARRGWRVIGVDRSTSLLARARAHAADSHLEAEFIQDDMRSLVRPASFDLVVSLFTSFGYFEDAADESRVLRHVCESLRPGGAFVMDLVGKEVLARAFQPTLSTQTADGTLVVVRGEIVRGWTRVRSEWTAIKSGTARTFRFEHWVYSGRELLDLLAAAGFDEMRFFGDFTGRAYDASASRLVAVARKLAVPREPVH